MNALAAAATTFGVVLLVELPDKTLIASLVLSVRYRPRPVLLGVAAAFAVQCVVAVVAGGLLHLLPRTAVESAVAVLFAIGAAILLREGFSEPEQFEITGGTRHADMPFWRIVWTAFGVLFAAEWGDASQLATAALAARIDQPVAVGIGSWLALVVVAALAVIAGRVLIRRIPIRVIHRVAGTLFAVFAIVTAIAAATD